ncbi:hypothetical protein MTR67_025941 [Solanum verrucosum]|uniref:Uncharacterized protein n=1 Tax=Solanum verrucosum TaxID=315347 RepID=A0AAF0TU01_SOLVR|nr:hypothetical protein MTR67_025941 [Solanum verrucosum]
MIITNLFVIRDIVEVPLHISDSNNEEELVERATLCIPSNIIKLSQQFGASFEGKLKDWGKDNWNNWRRRREDILCRLSGLESIMEQRALTDDKLQKAHLAMEFEELAKNEEITWSQRSRVQWLKNGDNTKYFQNSQCS